MFSITDWPYQNSSHGFKKFLLQISYHFKFDSYFAKTEHSFKMCEIRLPAQPSRSAPPTLLNPHSSMQITDCSQNETTVLLFPYPLIIFRSSQHHRVPSRSDQDFWAVFIECGVLVSGFCGFCCRGENQILLRKPPSLLSSKTNSFSYILQASAFSATSDNIELYLLQKMCINTFL